MYVFLVPLFFLMINSTVVASFGSYRTQQRPTQTAPVPAAAQVTAPSFSDLQATLDKDTQEASDMASQTLDCFTFTYQSLNSLLSQNASDWKGYFSSGSGANTIKGLANKINEANMWLSVVPMTTTPPTHPGGVAASSAPANHMRHSKALNNYIATANAFNLTLQSLGIQGQLPAILMPSPPTTPATTPAASQSGPLQSATTPPVTAGPTPQPTMPTPAPSHSPPAVDNIDPNADPDA